MSKKDKALINLDLSYGEIPDGHQFIRPPKFDPLKYPWNLKDESVGEVHSAFLLNRIPGAERGRFMDELWRVLVPADANTFQEATRGKVTMIVPYYSHPKTTIDPHFQYPPFSEMSFYIFNKGWRESQKLANTCKCDFDFNWGYNLEDETKNRNSDTQPFWIKHYNAAVVDLHVFLTKRA